MHIPEPRDLICHLLVPGLFDAVPQRDTAPAIPRLSNLERLLARADREVGAIGYAETAMALFGQPAEPGTDPPTAPLCLAQETQTTPGGWWMHADPVHLRPDQDRLILFDGDALDISAPEAADCTAAFNAHFSADGLELHAVRPDRWYLRLAAPPGVATSALPEVAGRNIDQFLPRGDRQSYWRQLMNEVQMLFHHLDVNQQRERRGVPAISGLWFSGAGRLPSRGATAICEIHGSDLLISALAGNANVLGDDQLYLELAPWHALLRADAGRWLSALQGLEQTLAECMGSCPECRVYPCNGESYRWRPGMRRRLWRRVRPFAEYR